MFNVLLIEDDPKDAQWILEMYSEARRSSETPVDFEAFHAKDLTQGVAELACLSGRPAGRSFDLILLDLTLPETQGMETFCRVLASAGHVPIVVLSGLDDVHLAVEMVRLGAQDYLVKGQVDARLLTRVSRYAIERKHAELMIRELNEQLEKRVQERTAELEKSHTLLRQAEKMSAVGRLAAGVAHEINNPLSVILGFTQSLIQHPSPPDLAVVLQSMEREAMRCKRLVQQLLGFSREKETEMQMGSPAEMIKGALALVETQARIRKVSVQRRFDKNAPKIRANSNQIQQIVMNLCTNAIDAMPDGGTLTLEIAGGDREVLLSVKDTGTGIPQEIQERIFDPFFTTKEAGLGTGLGLSLACEMVHRHKGHLEVQSQVGAGSTFTVHLPAAADALAGC